MTRLWSHRQGFRPALRDEFWTAFYTALRSRLIPKHKGEWKPFYSYTFSTDWYDEGQAVIFMKEHIGHSIRLYDTYESSNRQESDDRVLDFVEVFHLMALEAYRQSAGFSSGSGSLLLDDYRITVNNLFMRFNQPFELVEGLVRRRGSETLEQPVERLDDFEIADIQLRKYLISARESFFDARDDRRLEGLRSLWDAFERLKSLGDSDKKKAVAKLIDGLSPYVALREHVNSMVQGLTDIGNKANIRHSEQRVAIIDQDSVLIEYLFFSCFALIRSVLQRQEELSQAAKGAET